MSLSQGKKVFDLITPFQGDPFVGHLSTPLTTSSWIKTYLNYLPVYKNGLSPILRGIQIGLAHGYFLLGPFTSLGPLRQSEAASFLGFVSTLALIFILTLAFVLYGLVSFSSSQIFTKKEWNQLSSGFLIGGVSGAGIGYLVLKCFSLNLLSL